MTVFVDSSALYALLDEDDAHHAEAADVLRRLEGTELVSHAFVVVEASALIGRRLPWKASEELLNGLLPIIDVEAVDSDLYASAAGIYRQSGSARISFVDRTSFALMQRRGIRRAFAFDEDFAREGFELVA